MKKQAAAACILFLLLSGAVVFFPGCGKGIDDGPETSVLSSKNIGAAGGTVDATDQGRSISILIPPNSLQSETLITISKVANAPVFQASASPVGDVYDIGPTGTAFLLPATITISYSDDEIPSGFTASDLLLYKFFSGAWNPLSSIVGGDKKVTTFTTSLSYYRIGAGAGNAPPDFDGVVSAVVSGPDSVLLTWEAAADAVTEQDKINYLIFKAVSSGAQDFSSPESVVQGVLSCEVSGVSPHTYYFVVRASDEAGNIDSNTREAVVTVTGSPVVTSVSPADGAQNISVASTITAAFSDAMKESTINENNVSVTWEGGTVAGSVAYNAATRTAQFSPIPKLRFGSRHYVSVSKEVENADGVKMGAPHEWSFTNSGFSSEAAFIGQASAMSIGGNVVHAIYADGPSQHGISWARKIGTSPWSDSIKVVSRAVYWSDLALSPANVPYIVYSTSESPTVRYQYRDGTSWSDVIPLTTEAGAGIHGLSIAIDASGKIHAAYQVYDVGLFYATDRTGAWSYDLVDAGEYHGSWCRIAIDSDNHPHIVYSVPSEKVRHASKKAGSWLKVDVQGTSASHISFDIGPGDDLLAAFIEGAEIKFAKKGSGSAIWTVGSAFDSASTTDVAADKWGNAHVVYKTTEELFRYATDMWGGSMERVQLDITEEGARPLIAVDSSGRVNICSWLSVDNKVRHVYEK